MGAYLKKIYKLSLAYFLSSLDSNHTFKTDIKLYCSQIIKIIIKKSKAEDSENFKGLIAFLKNPDFATFFEGFLFEDYLENNNKKGVDK